MLSTHPQPGRLRFANNLVPTHAGGLATRPGAVQIVSGSIAQAAPWGNRALLEKQGRIVLFDGKETDLAPAGRGLQATSFQALTTGGQREDRLYVADGIRPLWYIARRSGVYGRFDILNKLLDAQGLAFPIPVASAVATWRGRLWADAGNRAQHCQFDDPDYWDPLFVAECQGARPDGIVALEPSATRLIAGLKGSLWSITGDTQFNWQSDPVADYGAAGPNAIAGDDQVLFWVSPVGLHQGGNATPLSDDLREIFTPAPYPAELAFDRHRRLLLLLTAGRLFVMHVDKPGLFGEITGHQPRGLLQLDDYCGWFGADGAWVLGNRDTPDRRLDGTETPFSSLYDTWEDIPNPAVDGRALLTRAVFVVNGSSRAPATYTVTASGPEGADSATSSVSLNDRTPQAWSDRIAGLKGEPWPMEPVWRELPVYLAGTKFRHQMEAACHMEILRFEPQYKFGDEA